MKKLFSALAVLVASSTVLFAGDLPRLDLERFWVPAGLKDLTILLQKNFEAVQAGTMDAGSIDATDLAADSVGTSEIIDGTIAAADLGSRSVTGAKLPICTAGQVLAGQADSNVLAKTISGAVTIDANGVTTIAPTTTVTRLVATEIALSSRSPVVAHNGASIYQLAYTPACTNGQVVSFSVTFVGALPAVLVSYSTDGGSVACTNLPYVHSKSYTNCVVVCDEGKTVDLVAYGIKVQ